MPELNHEQAVLAAIIPDGRSFLPVAASRLSKVHFRDPTYRTIFQLVDRYYNLTGQIVAQQEFSDLLRRSKMDEGRILLLEEAYTDLSATHVADHQFKYAVDALRDIRAEQETGEALAHAMTILTDGETIGKDFLQGHRDSRSYLYTALSSIDRIAGTETSPEGDLRSDVTNIMQQYADRKSGKITAGIFMGVQPFDLQTAGMNPGELILIAGYTGDGKSHTCVQAAWNAAVLQGKNVFFATSETVREQIIRRLVARHSRQPQFNYPDGLDSSLIKLGRLDDEQEAVFQAVLEDMRSNPAYGKLHIAQIPRGATLGQIEAKTSKANQDWRVDLLVIDYLTLIKPDRHRQSSREEMNDVIREAKVMATTFDDGRGIPVLSPWQVGQDKYLQAVRDGGYSLASLAETSEASKTADVVISLLGLPDVPHERIFQFLKLRDGEQPPPVSLETRWHCSYLGVRAEGAIENLIGDEL